MGPVLLEELAHNGPLRIPDEYDYHQLCDKFDLMRSTPPVMRAPVLRGLWFPYVWQRIVAQRRLQPQNMVVFSLMRSHVKRILSPSEFEKYCG